MLQKYYDYKLLNTKFVDSLHNTITLRGSPNSKDCYSFRDSTAGKLVAYNKLKRRKIKYSHFLKSRLNLNHSKDCSKTIEKSKNNNMHQTIFKFRSTIESAFYQECTQIFSFYMLRGSKLLYI